MLALGPSHVIAHEAARSNHYSPPWCWIPPYFGQARPLTPGQEKPLKTLLLFLQGWPEGGITGFLPGHIARLQL
jgi:hypothetical protein